MAVNNNVIDACAYESNVLELDNSVLTTAKSNVAFSRSSDMISIFYSLLRNGASDVLVCLARCLSVSDDLA